MVIVDLYAIVIAVFWLTTVLYLVYGRSMTCFLSNVIPEQISFPSIVIVVPVRNEGKKLKSAMNSLFNLRYPRFKVIAINDRSTDDTQAILEELGNIHSNLTIVKVKDLPEGWLGKNHALYTGYQKSTEDWILFTDADVHFKQDTLEKAIAYVTSNSLDHLTIIPGITSPSSSLNALLGTFVMMLELKYKPWLVRQSTSNIALGVGAFNLVKRSAYKRAGTHLSIRLRPDDDLKLGEQMKKSGGKSDALYGHRQIWLEWYPSVSAFIDGLMKNTFSIFDYKWWRALLIGVLPVSGVFVLPVFLLFTGNTGLISYAIILVSHFILFKSIRGIRTSWWHFLTMPLSGMVMLFIVLRSTFTTMWNGGIYWRDTFYPLRDLRKNIR